MTKTLSDRIRPATENDIPAILQFIRDLADFEKLAHEVVATEADLRTHIFGENAVAEVLIAEVDDGGTWQPAGFALYFRSFSTFLARPGIYLEDLFVQPKFRSHGLGRKLLAQLAAITHERGYGRLEWSVLDWNQRAWDFYKSLGAVPKEEWTGFRLSGEALAALVTPISK